MLVGTHTRKVSVLGIGLVCDASVLRVLRHPVSTSRNRSWSCPQEVEGDTPVSIAGPHCQASRLSPSKERSGADFRPDTQTFCSGVPEYVGLMTHADGCFGPFRGPDPIPGRRMGILTHRVQLQYPPIESAWPSASSPRLRWFYGISHVPRVSGTIARSAQRMCQVRHRSPRRTAYETRTYRSRSRMTRQSRKRRTANPVP